MPRERPIKRVELIESLDAPWPCDDECGYAEACTWLGIGSRALSRAAEAVLTGAL
jgi:hypothetical protein